MATDIRNLESTVVSGKYHDINSSQRLDSREVSFKDTDEENPKNDNEERQPLKVCTSF